MDFKLARYNELKEEIEKLENEYYWQENVKNDLRKRVKEIEKFLKSYNQSLKQMKEVKKLKKDLLGMGLVNLLFLVFQIYIIFDADFPISTFGSVILFVPIWIGLNVLACKQDTLKITKEKLKLLKGSNFKDLEQRIRKDKTKYSEMTDEYIKIIRSLYISTYNKSLIPELIERRKVKMQQILKELQVENKNNIDDNLMNLECEKEINKKVYVKKR